MASLSASVAAGVGRCAPESVVVRRRSRSPNLVSCVLTVIQLKRASSLPDRIRTKDLSKRNGVRCSTFPTASSSTRAALGSLILPTGGHVQSKQLPLFSSNNQTGKGGAIATDAGAAIIGGIG